MEENKPTQFEKLQFYAKYTVIIVSAAWVLISGTDFIDKQTKELRLKNERISKNSIPLASHTMDVKADNPPWILDNTLCTVTGQYKIDNIGELPFLITDVEFSIYESKVIGLEDVKGNIVTSLTLFNQLKDATPIFKEVLDVNERVGVKGALEKSFSYVIRKKANTNYVIVANAFGGLTDVDGKLDSTYLFGKNELTHTYGPVSLCIAPEVNESPK